MTITPLQQLIQNRDAFESIRDQITALLVFERDNQMSLATAAGEDPTKWDFRIYAERSLPWNNIVTVDDVATADLRPIVNVWYDSDTFAESSSNRAETQKTIGTYNIDVYGFGASEVTQTGQMTADQKAVAERDRAARLTRQILMASQNAYLQLPRGTAWDRKLESRQSYQPRLDQQTSIETVAIRLRFNVSFNEVSPQYQGVPLDRVTVQTARASDGQVILTTSYDYSN